MKIGKMKKNDIITENDVKRLRRKAARQGYGITKGKDAYGCIGFMIFNLDTNTLEAGFLPEYSMSYSDVEKFLLKWR